jgi:phosphate transport system protein
MGQVAELLVAKAGSVIATHDVEEALQIERDDDEMDRLHRALFTELLDVSAPYSVEVAIDVTLVSRYYERFADHAVAVARRVVYLVTGQHPSELAESV